MFECLGEFSDSLIRISMLNAIAHTVVQMSFQNDLPYLVQGVFGRVYLNQYIFAGYVLVDHFIDRLDLPQNFLDSSV